MTSGGSGGSDQPPRPEPPSDPLQHPASDAGWADERPNSGDAATVEVAPSVVEPADSTSSSQARATTATPPSPIATTPPSPAGEEPLLPATYHENDLRLAVGASPRSEPTPATSSKGRASASDRRHDDDSEADEAPHQPRDRTAIVVAAISLTAGLAIAGLVLLGRVNSDRYVLACEAERAVPQQGRSFPPWGTHALAGEPWKPLKITAETRCQPHETDDPLALERLYLSMILDQATALLTAREVTKFDDAEALLKQALLLTRPPAHEPEKLASERNEHHQEIERMLGDVTYWRASAKLRDARAALADAAKQFDSAAAQHPRHVSDAAAWATYARKLAQELHAGPAGATPAIAPTAPTALSAPSSAAPTPEHPNVPVGVALPVEPTTGSADEPAPTPAPPAPATPDAGVPTGGVLL